MQEKNCTFTYTNIAFERCTFIRPSEKMINFEPSFNNGAFTFTNNVVEYCSYKFIETNNNVNKALVISNNIFRNIKLESGMLINFIHKESIANIVNNTFSNLTCAKGSYGGGIASWFRNNDANYKVALKFKKCKFYDIKTLMMQHPQSSALN